jgi:hypothetical protein
LAFVGKHEPEGVKIAKATVEPGSTIIADKATHWDALPADHFPALADQP